MEEKLKELEKLVPEEKKITFNDFKFIDSGDLKEKLSKKYSIDFKVLEKDDSVIIHVPDWLEKNVKSFLDTYISNYYASKEIELKCDEDKIGEI